MKTIVLFVGLTGLFLSACSASLPSDDEVKVAVTAPLLSHASYNGVTLPQDAVSVGHIEILSIKEVSTANAPHYQVEANAAVVLAKSGTDISNEIGKNGIEGAFALQRFTESLGFTLKSGQTLHYKIHADLIKQDNRYAVDDGSVEPL